MFTISPCKYEFLFSRKLFYLSQLNKSFKRIISFLLFIMLKFLALLSLLCSLWTEPSLLRQSTNKLAMPTCSPA